MKIDMEALYVAFGDDSVERSYYIDRDSGRVFNVLEDHDDPETQELVWQLESDTRQRYLQIPKPTMEETLREQDAFLESLEEGELKTKLNSLVEDDHDGSKFAEFVSYDKKARDAWRSYRMTRSREQAKSWLETLDLK